jgi:hypothetical protein
MSNEMNGLLRVLRDMSGTFMRVARGAGSPEALIGMAIVIVREYEALKKAGVIKGGPGGQPLDVDFSKALYYGSDTGVVREIKAALNVHEPTTPNTLERAMEDFIAPALRIAAGRQMGESAQAKLGERDMQSALASYRYFLESNASASTRLPSPALKPSIKLARPE